MDHFTDGRAVSSDRNLPVKWSGSENTLWKTPLPEAGNSTPIVWEERVFITQAFDGGKTRSLICFDRATGKKLWQHDIAYPHKETANRQNPFCSGSPTTDGKFPIDFRQVRSINCQGGDGSKRNKQASKGGATDHEFLLLMVRRLLF